MVYCWRYGVDKYCIYYYYILLLLCGVFSVAGHKATVQLDCLFVCVSQGGIDRSATALADLIVRPVSFRLPGHIATGGLNKSLQ